MCVTCVTRKVIVKILKGDGWQRVHRMQTAHFKFQKMIDGNLKSVVFAARREYSTNVVKHIAKDTGIPFERFIRSRGSKKHQNGFGTFGLFRGSFN
jgi:predicted RNA binding protein YcfA (HicA-like mRNA interferase family)|tara:strand:+ start:567 stop:854 length:288 start_codon:yes stop_codon:yes gene_type:complete